MNNHNNISIIIPAKNEAESLQKLLPLLQELFPDAEKIVVNDGSTDNTNEIVSGFDIKLISNPYSMGNGAAIKAGARAATKEILVFMDGDGQHQPGEIPLILDKLAEGYDMVVGYRDKKSHASVARSLANSFYNWFASRITGQPVRDLTSGFRAIYASRFREFIYLLPNGFSYPTTITISMFRAGYKVTYVPVNVIKRTGKSHIRLFTDGIRFLMIIFKVGTLYTPLKFFLPISVIFFISSIAYYAYTYFTIGRFTNMGLLLFISSIIIFLIGLISEQLTVLLYSNRNSNQDK